MIVVSDTSAITNLAAINQLKLLPLLDQQVIIPEAVYRELVDIEPPVPGSAEVQAASWLEVKLIANREVVERLQSEARLAPGESEAIALALELGAALLLIDERRGRAEAARLSLKITAPKPSLAQKCLFLFQTKNLSCESFCDSRVVTCLSIEKKYRLTFENVLKMYYK